MGAEGSSYQYLQLEDELPVSGNQVWTVHNARSKEGVRTTVFLYNSESNTLLHNTASQLKRLRHPSVLKFLALTKSSLVTEHVTPLEVVLDGLSATEIAGGVHDILEALIFLHDRVGLTHNNVCMTSVYVSDDGGWRLGGMEHVCAFHEATDSFLTKCKPLRNEAAIAPEEKAGKVDTSTELGHARDAFAFGILAESLLECLSELGDMTKTFELRIQDELLHPDPKMRPHLRTLPTDRLFRNEFLEIVHFLQHITLKSEEEKKVFFSCLVKKLYGLPSSLVASRLARPLLSRFVLLDTTALRAVIPHLLTPCSDKVRGEYSEDAVNPLLMTAQFTQFVVPELYKIFHVRDAHIRLVLLSCFSQYVRLFDKVSLEKVILPQILLGLRDTNDELVKASLLAVSELVPILGGDVVIGTHRDKIFAEGVPKFGTRGSDVSQNKPGMPINTRQSNGVLTSNTAGHNNTGKDAKTLKETAKEADREKRRDEMKLRNKERRRKREEKAKVENTDRSVNAGESNTTIDMAKTSSELGNVNKHNELNRTEPSSPDSCDWSDSEDDRMRFGRDSDDYDYDKEIEDELNQMGSISPPTVFQSIEHGMPVSVDWSDVQNKTTLSEDLPNQKTRGMLKLKSKSKSSPPPKSKMAAETEWAEGNWGFQDSDHGTVTPRKSASPKVHSPRTKPSDAESDSTEFDRGNEWGDDWGGATLSDEISSSSHHDSFSHLETHTSNSPKQTQDNEPIKLRLHKNDKELGSEFDIMSIKIKPTEGTSDPFDFFSDMEPVIKAKNPLAELVERATATATSRTKGSDRTKDGTLLFAIVETDEMADGWGDSGWSEEELDVNLDS